MKQEGMYLFLLDEILVHGKVPVISTALIVKFPHSSLVQQDARGTFTLQNIASRTVNKLTWTICLIAHTCKLSLILRQYKVPRPNPLLWVWTSGLIPSENQANVDYAYPVFVWRVPTWSFRLKSRCPWPQKLSKKQGSGHVFAVQEHV